MISIFLLLEYKIEKLFSDVVADHLEFSKLTLLQ